MPFKPAAPCSTPGCKERATTRGKCARHAAEAAAQYAASHPDTRPSAADRGYDARWRRVRIEVLKQYGIPKAEWPLYDVDHNPPYDPGREPDHRKYTLIPRLHGDHSRKTNATDRGWGNPRRGG